MTTYNFNEKINLTSKTRKMRILCSNVNGHDFEMVKDVTEQMFGKRRKYEAYGKKNADGKMVYTYRYNMTDKEYFDLCEEFYK